MPSLLSMTSQEQQTALIIQEPHQAQGKPSLLL